MALLVWHCVFEALGAIQYLEAGQVFLVDSDHKGRHSVPWGRPCRMGLLHKWRRIWDQERVDWDATQIWSVDRGWDQKVKKLEETRAFANEEKLAWRMGTKDTRDLILPPALWAPTLDTIEDKIRSPEKGLHFWRISKEFETNVFLWPIVGKQIWSINYSIVLALKRPSFFFCCCPFRATISQELSEMHINRLSLLYRS